LRYRFKGIIRTTGQSVEGHAHGDTPEEAYAALSEHGIVTESLREEPETLAQAGQQPLTSAIDSALDTAAAQVPFDEVAKQYKGKSVWVIDRDKIRKRVSQVVDSALREALRESGGNTGQLNANELRQSVADAIGGLFKDNRNLTSQVGENSMKMDHTVRRIEQMVLRAESVLAQMTIAISRMGAGGYGGGGGGPRRFTTSGGGGSEQNTVLLEIFKENLRLRGISIDEPPPAPAEEGAALEASPADAGGTAPAMPEPAAPSEPDRVQRPASPLSPQASSPELNNTTEVELQSNQRGEP
jgi:hypothetical protein